MTATVWGDPEKLTHAELAKLVTEIQDEIQDWNAKNPGGKDINPDDSQHCAENIEYLLIAAELGPRKVGAA